ncbi:hypothetical protein GF351_01455 [Candidatus Woesearchaeota archaeon]|nr:hypothetical protein [Candidatus Woesearchaeota archaeon]
MRKAANIAVLVTGLAASGCLHPHHRFLPVYNEEQRQMRKKCDPFEEYPWLRTRFWKYSRDIKESICVIYAGNVYMDEDPYSPDSMHAAELIPYAIDFIEASKWAEDLERFTKPESIKYLQNIEAYDITAPPIQPGPDRSPGHVSVVSEV